MIRPVLKILIYLMATRWKLLKTGGNN